MTVVVAVVGVCKQTTWMTMMMVLCRRRTLLCAGICKSLNKEHYEDAKRKTKTLNGRFCEDEDDGGGKRSPSSVVTFFIYLFFCEHSFARGARQNRYVNT